MQLCRITSTSTFTTCEQTGKLRGVGLRWLWVDLSFLSEDSFRKMRTKRDELLRALEAMGAKPFVPSPGRYLLDKFVRQIPGESTLVEMSMKNTSFFGMATGRNCGAWATATESTRRWASSVQ